MNSNRIFNEEEKTQIKSKLFFNKLKSDYFLMKVFDIMKKNKSLEMVKINKKLQKRLNLSINDYKNYSELYSSIEIELKVISNKLYIFKNNNNIFIRINDKDKEYFHIYCDDSKEEIKRNYFDKNDNANKIKIIIDHQIKSFKDLFFDCICISSIYFKKFFRINITDMSGMFNGCYNLQKLNISNFNTNNVTNMSRMFYECQSLKELNISIFNTNNVTNMSSLILILIM